VTGPAEVVEAARLLRVCQQPGTVLEDFLGALAGWEQLVSRAQGALLVAEVLAACAERGEGLQRLVEITMSAHWDMSACHCPICDGGRALGCAPREGLLPHHLRAAKQRGELSDGGQQNRVV
jgi:hypothetical protein